MPNTIWIIGLISLTVSIIVYLFALINGTIIYNKVPRSTKPIPAIKTVNHAIIFSIIVLSMGCSFILAAKESLGLLHVLLSSLMALLTFIQFMLYTNPMKNMNLKYDWFIFVAFLAGSSVYVFA